MLRRVLLGVGLAYLIGLIFFAFFIPMRIDPIVQNARPHMPPFSDGHFLGTDELGRDTLARIAAGAKVSLLIGLTVQSISLILGITVGVLGVFSKRWISNPLMRFTDGMFAFPDILLGLLLLGLFQTFKTGGGPLAALLQDGTVPVVAVLAVTSWPSIARLVRTQLATLKDREFVVAAKASGGSTFYLVTRHIMPQLWGILLAVTMVELAATILAESTLSFLGIGIQAPLPAWGGMINTAREGINSYPITLLWPCLVLSMTIFALNFVGDGIRAIVDPKSR